MVTNYKGGINMKKLLTVLFATLLISTTVFAQEQIMTTEESINSEISVEHEVM